MRRALALALALTACHPSSRKGAGSDAGEDGAQSASEPEETPPPRPGMIWIPKGILIAGTPFDRLPRIADEEMAGEQVVMRGFFIDAYPYPNEVGAIPTTNIDYEEAVGLCEKQGKRLCTELELERACKGPSNTTYEYGDAYKPSVCGTGTTRTLVPGGVNASCQSAFGVHDLHGSSWTWTASQWKRNTEKSGLVTQRGGNGPQGELVGRCAHGRGMKPDVRRDDVGVRCCAGEPNTFEVVISVTRGETLRWQLPEDRIAPQLEKLVPEDVKKAAKDGQFKMHRLWAWHPLGNEELWMGGGCARPGAKEEARCGVVISRLRFESAALLAWVPSDYWQPTLGETDVSRELYLYGGDKNGAFRRKVIYAWGRITLGERERKKRRKGQPEPEW